MMACGGAFVALCALTSCRRNTSAAQRACLSFWAVWDCEVQFGRAGLPSGLLGRLSADGLIQTSRCGHPIRREFGTRPRLPVVGGSCFCHVVAHRHHGVWTSFVNVGGGSSS